MGTSFTLGVVEENREKAETWLDFGIKEIQRIETLLSEFLPDSTTSKINTSAHKAPLVVDDETFNLLERSLSISNLSKGAFDITVGPLKGLYQFKNTEFKMPQDQRIQEALNKVGYKEIELDRSQSSICFLKPGMKVSFAAIGKGYASDRVKQLWMEKGLKSGFINASGDLNVFGTKAENTPWNVGISNPNDPDNILMYVPLDNSSVATSGDYEQHFTWKGKRYSHNINPYTGLPMEGIKSVTVFSPKAELSDALATAVYVKGCKFGIDFINQLPSTHCIVIDDKNDIHFSKNMNYETAPI